MRTPAECSHSRAISLVESFLTVRPSVDVLLNAVLLVLFVASGLHILRVVLKRAAQDKQRNEWLDSWLEDSRVATSEQIMEARATLETAQMRALYDRGVANVRASNEPLRVDQLATIAELARHGMVFWDFSAFSTADKASAPGAAEAAPMREHHGRPPIAGAEPATLRAVLSVARQLREFHPHDPAAVATAAAHLVELSDRSWVGSVLLAGLLATGDCSVPRQPAKAVALYLDAPGAEDLAARRVLRLASRVAPGVAQRLALRRIIARYECLDSASGLNLSEGRRVALALRPSVRIRDKRENDA